MKCHKCGADPRDGGVWLERVNEKGVPGIFECRPKCRAQLTQEEAVLGAIAGDNLGADDAEFGMSEHRQAHGYGET